MPVAPPRTATAPRTLLAVVAVIVVLVGLYVWRERSLVPPPEIPIATAPPLPRPPDPSVPAQPPSVAAAPAPPGSAAPSPPLFTAPAGSVAAGSVPTAPPPAAGTPPSFDIVRVAPSGAVVVAGRAAPGATVVVREGAHEIARVRADGHGAFVATPAAPLAPGGREITLASRPEGSATETRSQGTVVLDVPAKPVDAPAAVLVAPGTAPRVLQGPVPDARPGPDAKPGTPTLDTVDYNDTGAIRFHGGAPPASNLRVYVDNASVGDTRATGEGRWSMTPAAPVAPGLHKVRVDLIGPGGQVASRIELPFERAALPQAEAAALTPGRVVVQPGQTLWRLARNAYGHGIQYTVLYLANRDQIKDARLIYPGQTFTIPPP